MAEEISDTQDDKSSQKTKQKSQNVTSSTTHPHYIQTLKIKDANGQVKELIFPKGLDLDRPKRARTTFTSDQLASLEIEFRRNQYLIGRERTTLASKLGLSETQVKVWYQNRRTKYKRDRERQAEAPTFKHSSQMFSPYQLYPYQKSTPMFKAKQKHQETNKEVSPVVNTEDVASGSTSNPHRDPPSTTLFGAFHTVSPRADPFRPLFIRPYNAFTPLSSNYSADWLHNNSSPYALNN